MGCDCQDNMVTLAARSKFFAVGGGRRLLGARAL